MGIRPLTIYKYYKGIGNYIQSTQYRSGNTWNITYIASKQLENRIKKRKTEQKYELSSIYSLQNKIIIVSLHHLFVCIYIHI